MNPKQSGTISNLQNKFKLIADHGWPRRLSVYRTQWHGFEPPPNTCNIGGSEEALLVVKMLAGVAQEVNLRIAEHASQGPTPGCFLPTTFIKKKVRTNHFQSLQPNYARNLALFSK